MSMKITAIYDDFSQDNMIGYRARLLHNSALAVSSDNNNANSNLSCEIYIRSIKAISFENLQIYAYSYSGVVKLYVKSKKLIDIPSGAGKTYVVFFTFNSSKTSADITSSFTYDTTVAADLTAFKTLISKISTEYSGKHFAIISSGKVTVILGNFADDVVVELR